MAHDHAHAHPTPRPGRAFAIGIGLNLAFVLVGSASLRGLSPAARLRLPVVLIVMHLSWGLGFLRGLPAE